jgi:hypothetical protein
MITVINNPTGVTPKKINLATAFSSAINLPRYKDSHGDFPLYPHGEGSKIQMNRSANWYKHAASTYNSPSNVRAVCLSKDAANVLYWASPVKGGKPTGINELAGVYKFDNSDKSNNRQSITPNIYRWDNAGLKCLVDPVIFSNIEELWIAAEILSCPAYEKYYNMLLNLNPGQVCSADFLLAILDKEISTPSKPRNIKDTFPLLRAIVVVNTAHTNLSDFHKLAIRTKEIDAALKAQSQGKRTSIGENPAIMKQLAASAGFGFAVCPVLSGDIMKFSLGDYKFDTQYLTAYKNAILKKYGEQPPAPAAQTSQTETPASAETSVAAVADTKILPEKSIQPQEYTETLAEVIAAMEAEAGAGAENVNIIRRALYAYMKAQPEYFKQQIPLLSADIRERYDVVFGCFT